MARQRRIELIVLQFSPFHGLLAFLMVLAIVEKHSCGQSAVARDLVYQGQVKREVSFVGFSKTNDLQFMSATGDMIISDPEEPIDFGWACEPSDRPLVCMIDGSMISANIRTLDRNQCVIDSGNWETCNLASSQLKAILFHPAGIGNRFDRQMDLLQEQFRADTLVLKNGDRLQGRFVSIKRNASSKNNEIVFVSNSSNLTLLQKQVAAILFQSESFHPLDDSIERTFKWVVDTKDGSQIFCNSWSIADQRIHFTGHKRVLKTNAFDTNEDAARFISGIRQVDRRIYLSNLKFTRFQSKSVLSLKWKPAKNRAVTGQLIRWGERVYHNGIGTRSPCSLIYAIPENTSHFQSLFALDASSKNKGSVKIRISLLSNSNEWKTAYESKIVRGKTKPQIVRLALGEAKAMALQVNDAGGSEVLDRLNWINASFLATPDSIK